MCGSATRTRTWTWRQQYGVPIDKGVPAIAVLDAHGKVVHAQSTGEFKDMRSMASGDVTEFLNRWKA